MATTRLPIGWTVSDSYFGPVERLGKRNHAPFVVRRAGSTEGVKNTFHAFAARCTNLYAGFSDFEGSRFGFSYNIYSSLLPTELEKRKV